MMSLWNTLKDMDGRRWAWIHASHQMVCNLDRDWGHKTNAAIRL